MSTPASQLRFYGRRAGWIENLPLNDFAGGLNDRDSPTEVAANETPDCLNITLDERGGIVKRLGLTRLNAGAMAGVAQGGFYSPSLQVDIVQIGAAVYKTTDWTSFTLVATFSTSARAAFTDFQQKLIAVHPVDGVFGYDGAAWALLTAAIKGSCVAAWQNKVFVSGDAANPSLVTCSATGNAGGWTVGAAGCAQNQLREKDDSVITALGIGQGEDISGRPGLLAFKGESAYRINDSATLAYTTIDGSAGAAGATAVVTLGGVTAVFNKRGIYVTDAAGTTELKEVSQKIATLFLPTQMNFAQLGGVVAGTYRGRIVFSFPWGAAQATNNRTFEYHPELGWIVPHDFGAAAFVQHAKQDAKLYTLSPTVAYGYETFKGGSDDGVAIAARYKTYEIRPTGFEHTFRRLRIAGRGIFQVYTLLDMSEGQGELNNASLTGGAFVWNDPAAPWGTGVWGPISYEDTQDFWDLGVAKTISFMLKESSMATATGPKPLEDGANPELGAFACYTMGLDHVQLGYS